MVLHMAALLFSLSWAGIVFFTTYAANRKQDDDTQLAVSFAASAVCFACIYYVLFFVSGVLLDIVNTLYICYAMDLDARHVTHPEIHAIYAQVRRGAGGGGGLGQLAAFRDLDLGLGPHPITHNSVGGHLFRYWNVAVWSQPGLRLGLCLRSYAAPNAWLSPEAGRVWRGPT